MQKSLAILIAIILILPLISSINLEVEKISSEEVMIKEIKNPATFTIKVKNLESLDTFRIFNLIGFIMKPTESIIISGGEEKEITLEIFPKEVLDVDGFFVFTYFIKNSAGEEQEEQLLFNIIELEEAFEVGSGFIDPESSSMEVFIRNTVNFNFPEVQAKFASNFFDFETGTFSLGPMEEKRFTVALNREDFKELRAGFYNLNSEITVNKLSVEAEGIIKFEEKNITTLTSKQFGLIINTQLVEKTNEGNTEAEVETVIRKNIISRLFTSFSPEPDTVERRGSQVFYTWVNRINPGETLTIRVKTNWFIPLIVIILIVAIVVLVKKYSINDLSMKKKVSFVKTKGGEFALKVTVIVNAKSYIEKVKIMDRLPMLVKIYERFTSEVPTRVDEKSKRIEWEFEKMEAGEIRVLSYIIYSKVGVLGKFALPSARATYELGSKFRESESNKAFFVAEQQVGEVEEEG